MIELPGKERTVGHMSRRKVNWGDATKTGVLVAPPTWDKSPLDIDNHFRVDTKSGMLWIASSTITACVAGGVTLAITQFEIAGLVAVVGSYWATWKIGKNVLDAPPPPINDVNPKPLNSTVSHLSSGVLHIKTQNPVKLTEDIEAALETIIAQGATRPRALELLYIVAGRAGVNTPRELVRKWEAVTRSTKPVVKKSEYNNYKEEMYKKKVLNQYENYNEYKQKKYLAYEDVNTPTLSSSVIGRWKNLRANWENLRQQWENIICDPLTVLDHPALWDIKVPATADFIDKYGQACDKLAVHPKGVDGTEQELEKLERLVREAAHSFNTAKTAAHRSGTDTLNEPDQKRARQAKNLLALAQDTAATWEERAAAAKKASELMAAITSVVLPEKTIAITLQLGVGDTSKSLLAPSKSATSVY